MFKDPQAVQEFIREEGIQFVDVRFTDLPGVQQHFTIPASAADDDLFTEGQLFDGSSIRGFADIHESDLQLIPDVTTAYVDPFRVAKTLVIIFDIYNPAHRRDLLIATRVRSRTRPSDTSSPRVSPTLRSSHLRPSSTSSTTCGTSRSPARARSTSVDSIEGAWNSRTPRRRRQPRQQDAVQGRLLPGGPCRQARRSA